MKNRNYKITTPVAVALALILGAATVNAAEYPVYLEAASFVKTIPDGSVDGAEVTMWGYSMCTGVADNPGTFDDSVPCSAPSSPGPQITVPVGDSLTVYLRNTLPEPTSIMIAGQQNAPLTALELSAQKSDNNGRARSFVPETDPYLTADDIGTYTWTNLNPGAFLYQSGSFVAKQVQMGLYGAMVQDSALADCGLDATTAGDTKCAYPDVAYDASQVLVFSEIDPALHNDPVTGLAAPEAANATKDGYVPRFFLINGEPYNGTPATTPIASLAMDGPVVTSPITVANASFEEPNCATGGVINTGACGSGFWTNGVVTGWSLTGTAGVFDPEGYAVGTLIPSDQEQVGYSNGGTLNQVTGAVVAAGNTYTLTVDVGDRSDTGFGTATIELWAGATRVAWTDSPTPTYPVWETVTAEYIAAAGDPGIGQPLEIRLVGTGSQEEFDNVRLDSTGPTLTYPRVMLRMINAGLENHAPQMLGDYFDVIAEDGHLSPVHKSQYSVFLPAAKSLDLLFTPKAAGTYPLFDRRLRLVNDAAYGGGMFHQIVVGGTP